MGRRVFEVAVIGAGIAGLYAAWRLREAAALPPADIGLFEAAGRVGGRILTVRPPGASSPEIDLGAHIIVDHHVRARMLLKRLGLPLVPKTVEEPGNLLHLRGRTLTVARLRRSFLIAPFPYALPCRKQKRGAGRLLRKAREEIAARTGSDGLFHGRRLADWPLGAALREVLSPDEIAYLTARSSYSFWDRPLNADAVIDWMSREFFMTRASLGALPGGMASLPERLARALEDGGVPVRLRHSLDRIDLPSRRREPMTLHFTTPDGPATLKARRVVLALPRRNIERIAPLGDHPSLRALLDTVEPWPVTTTALIYPDAWWTGLGFGAGRTITDLEARIMHYQAGEPQGNPPDDRPEARAAITFYADGASAGFWKSTGAEGWVGPSHPVTAAMHDQVCLVHRQRLGRALPQPLHGFVQEWAAEPAGAAFHLWAHGSDPRRAMAAALRPVDGLDLHICGEAWSNRQGWIEGALETVDSVLDRHFGLTPFDAAALDPS